MPRYPTPDPSPLYDGTPEEPAIAVQLGQQVRVYVRAGLPRWSSELIRVVPPQTLVNLSPNRLRGVVANITADGKLAWRWIDGAPGSDLEGYPSLEPSDDGETVVATFRERDEEPRIELIGRIARKFQAKRLRFARPAPKGRMALVADDETLKLVREDGQDRNLARNVDESWFSADGDRVYYRRGTEVHHVSMADGADGQFEAEDGSVHGAATGPGGLEAFVQRKRLTVVDPQTQSVVLERSLTDPDGPEYRSVAFAPDGRLAVGWLDITRFPARDGRGGQTRGAATVGVDLYDRATSGSPAAMPPIPVELWNQRSPRVDFDGSRLILFTWPSVWEWRTA